MKKTFNYWKNNAGRLAAVLCVSLSPVLAGVIATGCAGDRYHESTGESIDDTSITARVKSALGGDPTYKYSDVHVATFKGTVQLSGFVDSRDARSRAVDLAKSTEGVKDVTDNIDVK